MKKGYWIVRADVVDMDKFTEYAKRTPDALSRYGGKFLARAGQYKVAEGASRTRNTLIEFPCYDSAIECWNSKEYQEAKTFRIDAAELDIVIVEGCEEL